MKTVVITQSNYLPWRGYFDMLRSADEVVLLDSVQYTRRDWRNRNIIKTPQGPIWLTIPVDVKGRYEQAIEDAKVTGPEWAVGHQRSIAMAYRRAAAFDEVSPWLFGQLREAAGESFLSKINERLLRALCACLGIGVPMIRCSSLIDRDRLQAMDPTERLIALAMKMGATHYLSGPAARAYLDVDRFTAVGLQVVWMDYSGYPDYPQLWGGFDPKVSVIDLLLNTGSEASRYLDREPGGAA